MRVVYIAGPFRAPTPWGIAQNVRRAERIALEVWKLGAVAQCPHLNTQHFQGELPDAVWIAGALELLSRCDAVFVLAGSSKSAGTRAELVAAHRHRIPVFRDLQALKHALREMTWSDDIVDSRLAARLLRQIDADPSKLVTGKKLARRLKKLEA